MSEGYPKHAGAKKPCRGLHDQSGVMSETNHHAACNHGKPASDRKRPEYNPDAHRQRIAR